jgi:hypothetical protein
MFDNSFCGMPKKYNLFFWFPGKYISRKRVTTGATEGQYQNRCKKVSLSGGRSFAFTQKVHEGFLLLL